MGTPVAGNDADVFVAANPSVATTNENCSDISGGQWLRWQANTHHYWDKRVAVTVESSANGSTGWAPVTGWTFQYVGGIVIFAVAPTNHFIRIATGNYWLVTQCADCNDWSLTLDADTADTTTFQSAWRLRTPTVKGGSAKISSFRVDDLLSKELGNLLAVVLYSDKSVGTRWEFFAYISSVSPKSNATGVIEQEANFAIDGDAFYLAT